ncbi:hypothetical protein [Tenggerimyces flavus]|uniref:Class I SAM-dependent methyltransferase n=1 Tax=Tenggerimyces flavus TaxID=1708749 RepID=A0ABV7Y4R9_9ACTN|nr:hypothetical protein [Tenggerimyces flavus]
MLDVGWGNGTCANRPRSEREDLRVVPIDLSPGLRPEVVGEADRLPFATASAGAVPAASPTRRRTRGSTARSSSTTPAACWRTRSTRSSRASTAPRSSSPAPTP